MVEPTPLKNMRKSNWMIYPIFGMKITKIFELPPPSPGLLGPHLEGVGHHVKVWSHHDALHLAACSTWQKTNVFFGTEATQITQLKPMDVPGRKLATKCLGSMGYFTIELVPSRNILRKLAIYLIWKINVSPCWTFLNWGHLKKQTTQLIWKTIHA